MSTAKKTETPRNPAKFGFLQIVEYTVVYIMGPSAAGKTHMVKNKLLKDINQDTILAIDGGDMREASCSYQNNLQEHGINTYAKIFKKDPIKKRFIKTIKKLAEKRYTYNTKCQDKCDNIKNTNFKEETGIDNLSLNSCYELRLVCKSIKTTKSMSCENSINYIQNQKPLYIAYVDTFAHPNGWVPIEPKDVYHPRLPSAKSGNFNKHIMQNPPNLKMIKEIFFLVLAPENVCIISGQNREKTEGKKYSKKQWGRSIDLSFAMIKKKIETMKSSDKVQFIITTNYGKFETEHIEKLKKLNNIVTKKQQLKESITFFNTNLKNKVDIDPVKLLLEIKKQFYEINDIYKQLTENDIQFYIEKAAKLDADDAAAKLAATAEEKKAAAANTTAAAAAAATATTAATRADTANTTTPAAKPTNTTAAAATAATAATAAAAAANTTANTTAAANTAAKLAAAKPAKPATRADATAATAATAAAATAATAAIAANDESSDEDDWWKPVSEDNSSSNSTTDTNNTAPPPNRRTIFRKRRIRRHYKALYDFKSKEDGEIELKVNDIVEVTSDKDTQGWVTGQNITQNTSGKFPALYVEEIKGGGGSRKRIRTKKT